MELNPQKGQGRSLRPSQLRSLQRQRKSGGGIQLAASPADLLEKDEDEENIDPNATAAMSLGNPFKKPPACTGQPPARPIINRAAVVQKPIPIPVELNWSLKTSVTFSTKAPVNVLKTWSQRSQSRPFALASTPIQSSASPSTLEDLSDCLTYYRFPFPSVSQAQRRKISGLLLRPKGNGKDRAGEAECKADLEYFEVLLNSWRKAFLSAYETLKTTKGSYFYYFQHDFGAVFRHDRVEGKLDVVLCKCNDGVKGALDREGIRYESSDPIELLPEEPIQSHAIEDEDPDKTPHIDSDEESDDEAESTGSEDDDDLIAKESIRREISARIKRRKLKKIHRRSQAQGTLRILDVHMFVDYLLNQRHGKSYVILPELLAPHPFLLATCCRSEMVVHGTDMHGVGRIRVNGFVGPEAVARIKGILHNQLGDDLELVQGTSEIDARTASLSSLPYH